MLSAILILVVLAAGVAAAFWFHELGGTVEIRVGEHFVGVSFPIALLILLAFILVVLGLVMLWGAIRRQPAKSRTQRLARRRREGDEAVTRALVALAAGSADQARIEIRAARQKLGDTAQNLLLTAEAERMAGRDKAAEEAFRTLAQREDARFLGLRGLLRQAMARGDWDAALALAREAEATAPGAAGWLREERAQLAIQVRNWREALSLAPPDAMRAPLALAAAAQEHDAARAAEYEKQAYDADHGFAPAALAYAKRLRDTGNGRRARTVLEEAWGRAPHPALAGPYLAEETDPLAQVKAAEALIRRNPQHPESRLLLARTALEAGLTGRARNALESLRREGRGDRRVFLMLAELEMAEKGDTPESQAAQSRLLREAANAPAEPRWRCGSCGTEHAQWNPVCNACDAVGQIAWTGGAARPVTQAKVPVMVTGG